MNITHAPCLARIVAQKIADITNGWIVRVISAAPDSGVFRLPDGSLSERRTIGPAWICESLMASKFPMQRFPCRYGSINDIHLRPLPGDEIDTATTESRELEAA